MKHGSKMKALHVQWATHSMVEKKYDNTKTKKVMGQAW